MALGDPGSRSPRWRRPRGAVGILAAGAALVGAVVLAVALARAGAGEVQISHATRPDATLPAGLPPLGGSAGVTPFTLTVPPPGATAAARLGVVGLDGSARTLGELRGPRATVVAFVASYCIPCREEVPALAAHRASLERAGVRLLVVDLQESASDARGFLRSRGFGGEAWLDPDAAAHDGLGLIGIPCTAILGPDGAVAERIEGYRGPGDVLDGLTRMGISAQ